MTEATSLASEQITQEDREAAALAYNSKSHKGSILAGDHDTWPIVQACVEQMEKIALAALFARTGAVPPRPADIASCDFLCHLGEQDIAS